MVVVRCGQQSGWRDFVPRLKRWMSFLGRDWTSPACLKGTRDFCWVARRRALRRGDGHPVVDHDGKFSKIEAILEQAAPLTKALTRRVADLPPLAKLAAKARQDTATTIAVARSRPRCEVLRALVQDVRRYRMAQPRPLGDQRLGRLPCRYDEICPAPLQHLTRTIRCFPTACGTTGSGAPRKHDAYHATDSERGP